MTTSNSEPLPTDTLAERSHLPPEVKAKWLDALRSGRYEQGSSCLRDEGNHYCCLGVLVDIVDPSGWSDHANACVGDLNVYQHRRDTQIPDFDIRAQLGIVNIATTLAVMNDGDDTDGVKRHSFAEIADWIEANL